MPETLGETRIDSKENRTNEKIEANKNPKNERKTEGEKQKNIKKQRTNIKLIKRKSADFAKVHCPGDRQHVSVRFAPLPSLRMFLHVAFLQSLMFHVACCKLHFL